MCLQLARGLPPAPSRGRGREGLRAGARVPKRPWRRRREGGVGRASPKLPPRLRTGGELRWPPREDWTRAPATFVIFLSVRSLLLPPWLSGLATAQGTETQFQSGRPLGGGGRLTQSILGGRGEVRVRRVPFSSCPRPRPPRPGLPAPALCRALLQRRERKPWVEIAFKKLTC